MTTGRVLLITIGAVALGRAAAGDTITLVGSDIPLRDCRIVAIQGGRVHFNDAGDRRQRRTLEEVNAIGFDGLPDLDSAEQAMREGDWRRATPLLLVACADADRDVSRLWTHVRLAQAHDLLGQFVQAAGHAATVFELTNDPTWRSIAPRSEPDEPAYAAAHETMTRIDLAMRRATEPQVRRLLTDLRQRVAPIHAKLAASYDGPIPEAGSTISGISVEAIRAGAAVDPVRSPPAAPKPVIAAAGTVERAAPVPESAASSPPVPPARTAPDPVAGDDSPEAIERLLAANRWSDAVVACERVERQPGPRDLARFLHQYGRGLDGLGRPRDAAVMWTRGAVHFRRTEAGLMCLFEVARLYRDHFGQPGTARRLLVRVIADAESSGHAAPADLARAMLREIPDERTDGTSP